MYNTLRISAACIIDEGIVPFAALHGFQSDGDGIAIVRLRSTLNLKIIRTHQVGHLRAAQRPHQYITAVVAIHIVLLLYSGEVIDTMECGYVDTIGGTRGSGRHISIGLQGEGSLKTGLNAIGRGYNDGAGTVRYLYGRSTDRGGIGLRSLVHHVGDCSFAIAYGSAVIVHVIEVGRLQLGCHELVRAIHAVGHSNPDAFVDVVIIGIICAVLEDACIHTNIELLANEVFRQVPVKLQIDDTLEAAVHGLLCRQGERLIARAGIDLHGTTAGGAGDLDGTAVGAQIDIRRTIQIGVVGVLAIRTAEIEKMGYIVIGLCIIGTGVPHMTLNTQAVVIHPTIRPNRNLEMQDTVSFWCYTVVLRLLQEIIIGRSHPCKHRHQPHNSCKTKKTFFHTTNLFVLYRGCILKASIGVNTICKCAKVSASHT